MAFGVRVVDRNGVAVLAPAGVRLTPTGWSAAALGGPVACEVAVTGETAALLGLAAWLGYGLEIVDEAGGVVWWGQVTGVEVTAGGVRRGLAIGDVANRVRLLYVRQVAGGGEEAAETAWSEDAASVARYGLRERVFSAGTLTDSQAAAMVATLLGKLAAPQRSVRLEGGAKGANAEGRLTGRGWFARLDDVYYENVAGLEEHNPGSGATAIPVGLGFTSVYLAFVDAGSKKLIQECEGKFLHFGEYGDLNVWVTGVAYNGGLKTVASGDGRAPVVYQSDLVTFGLNDDLHDGAFGLEFIATDDVIFVTGAERVENRGSRRVETTGISHIEVSPGWNGGFVDSDGAEPTITILRGNGITITTDVANEPPNGTTVETVAAWGQRVYQTLGLAANTEWAVDRIELRVRKVGSPADSLRVGLYTDGGGVPGTLIEQVTVAGSALAGEVGWVAFALSSAPTVEYGVSYGIQIDRTGAMDALNFYEAEIDADAGYSRGALALHDGAAWQTGTGDLIFRVVGAVNALDLATAVVSQAGTEIGRTVMEATTGVEAWQYAEGEETAGAVLRRLLEMGDSSGRRLLATVTPDRALRVAPQGEDYLAWLRLEKGLPGWLDGTPLQAGVLPVGVWMELGDVALLSEAWAGLDRVFVERASYRVGQGWEIEAEGQRSVVERLGVQMG
jgi:hypothetical protein